MASETWLSILVVVGLATIVAVVLWAYRTFARRVEGLGAHRREDQ